MLKLLSVWRSNWHTATSQGVSVWCILEAKHLFLEALVEQITCPPLKSILYSVTHVRLVSQHIHSIKCKSENVFSGMTDLSTVKWTSSALPRLDCTRGNCLHVIFCTCSLGGRAGLLSFIVWIVQSPGLVFRRPWSPKGSQLACCLGRKICCFMTVVLF